MDYHKSDDYISEYNHLPSRSDNLMEELIKNHVATIQVDGEEEEGTMMNHKFNFWQSFAKKHEVLMKVDHLFMHTANNDNDQDISSELRYKVSAKEESTFDFCHTN